MRAWNYILGAIIYLLAFSSPLYTVLCILSSVSYPNKAISGEGYFTLALDCWLFSLIAIACNPSFIHSSLEKNKIKTKKNKEVRFPFVCLFVCLLEKDSPNHQHSGLLQLRHPRHRRHTGPESENIPSDHFKVTNSSALVGWIATQPSKSCLVAPIFTATPNPWSISALPKPTMCSPTTFSSGPWQMSL